MVNGMVTHSSVITDSMYDNACLHQEEGEWQTVFGLDVLPQYRCRGYGGQLMQHLVTHAKEQGRKGCILTCKQGLIPYYQRLGYQQEGVSQSIHGGAVWYDMRLIFPEGRIYVFSFGISPKKSKNTLSFCKIPPLSCREKLL